MTATYQVKGMTCDHCVRAVRTELSRIDGVSNVNVDLATGVVTVESAALIPDDAVRAAVDEAGYEVVP